MDRFELQKYSISFSIFQCPRPGYVCQTSLLEVNKSLIVLLPWHTTTNRTSLSFNKHPSFDPVVAIIFSTAYARCDEEPIMCFDS